MLKGSIHVILFYCMYWYYETSFQPIYQFIKDKMGRSIIHLLVKIDLNIS